METSQNNTHSAPEVVSAFINAALVVAADARASHEVQDALLEALRLHECET